MLIELFWSFIQVGLFGIGGGMAAIPLIQNQVVDVNKWLTLSEFTDLITIAQMTPGPIAINSATFVGIRIAGIPGAIVATLGCIVPSIVIISILAWMYFKYKKQAAIKGVLSGLRIAVVSLIASAGMTILILAVFGEEGFVPGSGSFNVVAVILFSCAIFILRKWRINPIYVMIGTGVAGGFIYMLL